MDETQRKAARLAGIMFLLTMAIANFGDFYVRRRLFTPADPVQTVRNIGQLGWLVRAGIASDLITIAGSVILTVALYAVLRPINRNVALIAVMWWLLECSVAAVVTLNSLAVLLFFNVRDSPQAFASSQWAIVATLIVSVDRAGNRIAGFLFGLGSILFCYLWFKSRYIPRLLAGWGILSSLVPAFVQLATVMFPAGLDVPLRRARAGIPIITFEVLLGLWLLVKVRSKAPIKESEVPRGLLCNTS